MITEIKPGTFFTTTDYLKHTTYPPGSVGVLSYIRPRHGAIWNLNVVMMRRGKKGMSRVERVTIDTPIFRSKNQYTSDYYINNSASIVHVVPHVRCRDIVRDFADMEFLVWANAYAWYLYHLSNLLENNGPLHNASKQDIQRASNINITFNCSDPGISFYSNADRQSLVETIRKRETAFMRHLYRYWFNIYTRMYGALNHLVQSINYSQQQEELGIIEQASSLASKKSMDFAAY